MASPLRVCYLGTYDREHVRNRVIIQGLRGQGAQVSEIHEALWADTQQRVAAARGGLWQPRLWWQLACTYVRLAWRYLRTPAHDIVIVGHAGHLDLPLARLLTWLRRKPLLFDALVSLYDTAVEDRGLLAPESWNARALLWLERCLYRLPERILVDTACSAAFLQERFRVPPERLRQVWVGAPDDIAAPVGPNERQGLFRVVYFGKFIPLHGLDVVLRAAALLRNQADIRFELLGDGQTYGEMRSLADDLALDNVAFAPEWLSLPTLARRVAGAGACLGVLSAAAKTQRVIPTKAFLALAWGLPLITGDTPGARELLTHGVHALLCPPADPHGLAEAILRLYQDRALGQELARQGYALYQERCSPQAIGAAVLALAHELLP
jgi:glycosyltransferase involved in cell wall biosynthesis